MFELRGSSLALRCCQQMLLPFCSNLIGCVIVTFCTLCRANEGGSTAAFGPQPLEMVAGATDTAALATNDSWNDAHTIGAVMCENGDNAHTIGAEMCENGDNAHTIVAVMCENGDNAHTIGTEMCENGDNAEIYTKDGDRDDLACFGFKDEKDDSLDELYNVPLDSLDQKMDVRELWAGGYSLEAWSDFTMCEPMGFVDSESVTGAVMDCFKDPIWSLHDPPDELPSVYPLDEDGELLPFDAPLDDDDALRAVTQDDIGNMGNMDLACTVQQPQLDFGSHFDFIPHSFEPVKLIDDFDIGTDMPFDYSDPDYLPKKSLCRRGTQSLTAGAMAGPSTQKGRTGVQILVHCAHKASWWQGIC
jgi:hypothetical protein